MSISLKPGEKILQTLHQHPLAYIPAFLGSFVLLIISSVIGGLAQNLEAGLAIGLLIVIITTAITYVYTRSFTYYITNQRIIIERRWIGITYRNIAYENIADIVMDQGIMGRSLGYGTVMPLTAGAAGLTPLGLIARRIIMSYWLSNIPNPHETYEFLRTLVKGKGVPEVEILPEEKPTLVEERPPAEESKFEKPKERLKRFPISTIRKIIRTPSIIRRAEETGPVGEIEGVPVPPERKEERRTDTPAAPTYPPAPPPTYPPPPARPTFYRCPYCRTDLSTERGFINFSDTAVTRACSCGHTTLNPGEWHCHRCHRLGKVEDLIPHFNL